MELFTACYSHMRDEFGVAVRTSIGEPKFPYDAKRRAECKRLMPWGLLREAEKATFIARYRERLEHHGVESIRGRLLQIVDFFEEPKLVLLCFENIENPGKWCHRTIFAEWWREQTGETVTEISGPQGALL
jgi:hypothetical protein